jgi:hypothetical protein
LFVVSGCKYRNSFGFCKLILHLILLLFLMHWYWIK